MKKTVKKVIVYSLLAGCVQFGLSTSIEASPRYEDQKYNQCYEQRVYREHRLQEEKERHEREMRRYDYESYREWCVRQEREKEQHDNTLNEIKAGLIGILIGSMIN